MRQSREEFAVWLSVARKTHVSVPANAFASDVPLVAVMRGDYVGSLHRGILAAVNPAGDLVLSLGDREQPVFLRSGAKPFQVLPAVLSGAIARFGIDDRELAVLCGSHSGEPVHTRAVLSVLEKIGLGEQALQCGVHAPIDEVAAIARWRAGTDPTPVCNNCSGAHAGMLVACRANNWPVDGYGSPDHPLQRQTRELLATFAGLTPGEVHFGVDNCHVPAYRLPLWRAALAFSRLTGGGFLSREISAAARRVVEAMVSFPEMVGGTGRFDTDLMNASKPRVLSKGGAEGFQGIGIVDQGLGIALKISDGNARAVAPAAVPVLRHLGALGYHQAASLNGHALPTTYDLKGEVTGRIQPVFSLED
jgi:L-asparaginase II